MSTSTVGPDDIVTSSGKYPERAHHPLAAGARTNAVVLADDVNALCALIGYAKPLHVSSGFRPPEVNAATPHAAKASYHMNGMACDFVSQDLGLAIRALGKAGSDALRTCHLFMEALESTPTWTHLDRGTRTDRPNREFKP